VVLAVIPSPSQGVWYVGPLPLRAYALAIILGVVVAVVMGERRWVARGGTRGLVTDVATIAVPFGILGARAYHVMTSPAAYIDDPVSALYVWEGGLGIPGGIAGGFVAGYVMLGQRSVARGAFADAIAPGVAVAQALGRFGNYFNQELFGRPTTLPWGLRIDADNPDAVPGAVAYHPTFLYESLWNLGVAALVIWADRRFRLGHGRAFALYLAAYAVGRSWIEALRIDDANRLFGVRLNDYVMAVVFLGAVAYLVQRRHSGREDRVETAPLADGTGPADDAGAGTASPGPTESPRSVDPVPDAEADATRPL
jgi:prolipoprotein diacylglyceryl transferase